MGESPSNQLGGDHCAGPAGPWRGPELLVKEALHIRMTPPEERFNRDGGLKVPGSWTAVMRRQGGRSNPHRPLTSNDVYPQ